MTKEQLQAHLRKAEAHVAQGREHVEKQQRLIAQLRNDGHDTTQARKLLDAFEATQKMHVEDRDRVLQELKSWKARSPDRMIGELGRRR